MSCCTFFLARCEVVAQHSSMATTLPIARMFGALSKAHAGTDTGPAYSLVRDLLDMGMIPVEEILPVIIGRRSLAELLRDAADVCLDCEGCGEDVETEAAVLAERMIEAAKIFETLGDVAPTG